MTYPFQPSRLPGFAMNANKVEKTAQEHGDYLNERRLDLGLKWSEVARDMERLYGEAVTPDYLSKIKRGAAPLAKMSVDAREALRKVLRIEADDWEADTGLYSPANETITARAIDKAMLLVAQKPNAVLQPADPRPSAQDGAVALLDDGKVEVPVYGMAAANPDGNVSFARPIGVARIPRSYADRENMHTYMVLGDSMDDGTADGIRDGDAVVCNHADTDLFIGKIYVVKLPGNGILLKRVKEDESGELFLASDNSKYRDKSPEDAQIIGRVVFHAPAGRPL